MYLKISVCFLNLYNFNQYELYDKIFLGIGIIVALLWLGFGVGMVRYMFYILHESSNRKEI